MDAGSGEKEFREVNVLVIFHGRPKKTFRFCVDDTVWTAKQTVLLEFASLNLTDPLNYGFYMPPFKGKAGKFLDEERPLRDYPVESYGEHLEFRYKRRIYRSVNADEKKLQKYQSKSYQRKFFEYLVTGNVEKAKKLLDKGLDPNFQDERTGETPLTAMTMMPNSFDACMALVSCSAYLDYRSADGMTAMHKAMINSRADSISFLLDLGASPNYKDAKGLTPLWHGIQVGSTAHCCELLLNERALLGISDHQGTHEIHLACKHGYEPHLEHLIFYGANLNCRTASGNTPLHICAITNQENCARILLFRGADRSIENYSKQSAHEVAVLSGNNEIATLIHDFDDTQVTPFLKLPEYSKRRRGRAGGTPTSPTPPQSALSTPMLGGKSNAEISDLQRCQTVGARVASGELKEKKDAMFSKRKNSNNNFVAVTREHHSDESASDSDSDEEGPNKHKTIDRRTFSTGAMARKAPAPIKFGPGTKAQLKSRLYPSIPGRQFVAVVDYQTNAPGELALETGDAVEVLFIGEQGFWEGRVKERTGWFPSSCIQELKKVTKKEKNRTWFGKKSNQKDFIEKVSRPDKPMPRTVQFRKGEKGFGFQLRGANSHTAHIEFTPTTQFPALQYIGEVDKGGAAEKVGLKPGDFIIEVNGEVVINATHGYVVSLVANTGKALSLKVITVAPECVSPDFSAATPVVTAKQRVKTPEPKHVEKTPAKDSKKTPPPPLPRSNYPSMTVGHVGSGSVLTEGQISSPSVDTVITLDKKGQRKRSVKGIWTDAALKLNPDTLRTEEISKGVVRKTKGISMNLPSDFNAVEENGLQQRSNSISSRASIDSPTSASNTTSINSISAYATLPRRFSRSGSQCSDETSSSSDQNRPQQPPNYEAALDNLRRLGRKPSFQRSESERQLLKAHLEVNTDTRTRTVSGSSDNFPPPPSPSSVLPAVPSYSPPPPPEEVHHPPARSISVPAQQESLPPVPLARTASEPVGQHLNSSDEEEPTSDFAKALRGVVAARKQRSRTAKVSIDETIALRKKEQSLHVIKENEESTKTFNSSSISKSSSSDAILQKNDSKVDYFSLYAASSTSSLDTQISKDSGIDVSDVLAQAPGEQPPDLASALANAVARRAEKIATKESTGTALEPKDGEVKQHLNGGLSFAGVKLKPVQKSVETHVAKPKQEVAASTPPPTRPKPMKKTPQSVPVEVAKTEKPVATIEPPVASTPPSVPVSVPAEVEERPDIVTPPLMFASNETANRTVEGKLEVVGQLEIVDGHALEPPQSPLPPPPMEFVMTENYPAEVEKSQPIVNAISAADPPPPYSPPRTKNDLPSSISLKPYPEWTCNEVGEWLDFINMGQYKESFLENDIQGMHLSELGKEDLSELGVKKLGHRLTIDDAIGKLRSQQQYSEV